MITASTLPADQAIAFGGVTPFLGVHDVAASIDYEVQMPGFEMDFQTPGSSRTRGVESVWSKDSESAGEILEGVRDAGRRSSRQYSPTRLRFEDGRGHRGLTR